MGFSQIVGQIAFIFIFLIMVTFLFNSYNYYFKSGSESALVLYDSLNTRLKTNIEIVNSTYTFGNTNLVLENTGTVALDINLIDVYSNGVRRSRDLISIDFLDNEYDPVYWNPGEQISMNLTGVIVSSVLYQVSTENGVYAYKLVSS